MRPVAAPFVVAPPTGARIRTRLRLSAWDEAVLHAVGEHLGGLASQDLAARCRLGAGDGQRAERKRALTASSSSRWAGTITRTSNDQWERAFKNLLDARVGLQRAAKKLRARLAVPAGSRRGRVRGYASQAERFQKQRRLQHLQARLAEVEARIAEGQVSVCRGGRRLAKLRHTLGRDDATLTEAEWRARWEAKRLFATADGEADKAWGNQTIRVHPDEQWLEIRLPTPLAHLSNTPGRASTYRLSCPVGFTYRGQEWVAQTANGAVRYDIVLDPAKGRGRWHLDASWRLPARPAPPLEQLRQHRSLGVDLNADHLAAWVLDLAGNPLGPPATIPLDLDGQPAPTRDGRLRGAVAEFASPRQGQRLPLADGGEPGLYRRPPRRPGDPWPREACQALAPHRLGDPHQAVPGPAGGHGRQRRAVDHRGGPRLHLGVGRSLLAGPAQSIDKTCGYGVAASCGGAGDRQAWARAPSPATGMVCPDPTGGWAKESYRLRRAARDPRRAHQCAGGRA
jgi:hypothetical protein